MSLEQQLDRLTNAIEANTKAIIQAGGATPVTPAVVDTAVTPKSGKPLKAVKPVAVKALPEDDGMGEEEEPEEIADDEPTTEDARKKLMELKAAKGREAAKDVMKALKITSANDIPDNKVAKLMQLAQEAIDAE